MIRFLKSSRHITTLSVHITHITHALVKRWKIIFERRKTSDWIRRVLYWKFPYFKIKQTQRWFDFKSYGKTCSQSNLLYLNARAPQILIRENSFTLLTELIGSSKKIAIRMLYRICFIETRDYTHSQSIHIFEWKIKISDIQASYIIRHWSVL